MSKFDQFPKSKSQEGAAVEIDNNEQAGGDEAGGRFDQMENAKLVREMAEDKLDSMDRALRGTEEYRTAYVIAKSALNEESRRVRAYWRAEKLKAGNADFEAKQKEVIEAFQEKYPWIQAGASFKFNKETPKPAEGVFTPDVYEHDFTGAVFTVESFFMTRSGQTQEVDVYTPITTMVEGQEKKSNIVFTFTLDELGEFGIEKVD